VRIFIQANAGVVPSSHALFVIILSSLKITLLWIVTSIDGCQDFGEKYYLKLSGIRGLFTPNVESAGSCESLLRIYQNTRCHISEDGNLHAFPCENLKSRFFSFHSLCVICVLGKASLYSRKWNMCIEPVW
jgi:hypothetical protein